MKKMSKTTKHVELGAMKERVDRVADRDGGLATASAVVRQAVSVFLEAWDAKHPENPSTRA